MKHGKSQKGFTLMEIVISVAIISIISWFVLQFFVISENANQKARDIDIASSMAISAIELIKSEELEKIINPALGSEFADFMVEEMDSTIVLTSYYDKNWNIIISGNTENTRFSMRITISSQDSVYNNAVSGFSSDGEIESTYPGRLYGISVIIIDVKADTNKQELVSYDTYKYYENKGGIGDHESKD